MKKLICTACGKSRDIGRRLCRPCYLALACKRTMHRYYTQGRYMYDNTCVACAAKFKAFRRNTQLCRACRRATYVGDKSTNRYVYLGYESRGKNIYAHRLLAEQLLGRRLRANECVHHIDEDVSRNISSNLLVMDRRTHGRLHLFLHTQRVIIERSMNENSENCWDTLIAPMTTAWLETTNAKVIKLWEIGQSAAEPLK